MAILDTTVLVQLASGDWTALNMGQLVLNLNADMLNGLHEPDFARKVHTHPGTDITSVVALATDADTVDGSHAADFAAASHSAHPDIVLPATGAVYLGAADTDGSWRIVRSGSDLVFQRRESGSWVTKGTILA